MNCLNCNRRRFYEFQCFFGFKADLNGLPSLVYVRCQCQFEMPIQMISLPYIWSKWKWVQISQLYVYEKSVLLSLKRTTSSCYLMSQTY